MKPLPTRNDIQSVGGVISEFRKRAGLTQAQVGEALRLEPSTISRIESGVISPTLLRLHQFAELFNVPIGQFIVTDEGEPGRFMLELLYAARELPPRKKEVLTKVARALQEMPD